MIKGLNETIYGLAFRNHRYGEGKWNVHFFETERQRAVILPQLNDVGEVFVFEFTLGQVKPEDKHGKS